MRYIELQLNDDGAKTIDMKDVSDTFHLNKNCSSANCLIERNIKLIEYIYSWHLVSHSILVWVLFIVWKVVHLM